MASAALAPPEVKDVTLSLFAGRKTDIAPSDLPEGLTPDEQDGIYLPGQWQSRPCLSRLYAAGKLSPGTSALYEKTYIQLNNDPLTLVLTSDGKLWAEDVGQGAGNPAQIGSVAPGLYAQSVSEFGREYIAFSDLLHGQGVPQQSDGTNLDRVTMDGPGAGPTIANFQPLPATIQNPGAPVVFNLLASANGIVWGGLTTDHHGYQFYTFFTVATTASTPFLAGQQVTIAGSASTPNINGTWTILQVSNSTHFTIAYTVLAGEQANGGGGTVTGTTSNVSLARASNLVTAVTAAAHNFLVGWSVQVSGVANTNIGGGVASISRDGNGVVTVTTTTPHGLPAQATIAISGVTNPDASFNGTFQVASVPSPTTFTYQQAGAVEASGAGTGNVQDIWNVTAFIQSTPTPTTFTYQQVGANDSTTAGGAASIVGQVSPGAHGLVVMWLTRQGALSRPSPPIPFVANGGNMLALSNLLLGPSNVVARVFGITGAGGNNYFALTSAPQVAGQITGTALLVLDNTSTTAILDFSDNTLFAGIPIDQVGNDLFDQVVLGPVLGFFAFASRLSCWGDYNKIENFLNLGFCGGYLPAALTAAAGWNSTANVGGALVNGGSWAAGMSWQITGDGSQNQKGQLSQSAFEDSFGDAIISPSTQYSVRLWAKVSAANQAGTYFLVLSSASTAFSAQAAFPIAGLSASGGFTALIPFSALTPAVIPADLTLSIYSVGLPNAATLTVTEHALIFTAKPYRDNLSRWSYPLNPEGFAETTGELGADDDESPIRCFALLRQSSLLETAEGVHIFADNTSEPDEWNVGQLTRAAGALSLRSGDPGKFGTGDAAEDWAVIASKNGVYLFAGSEFWKVSQEISRGALPQSQDPRKCWDDINWAAQQTIVAKNDPSSRRAYFAVPINGALTPNVIFVLDYHEMDTATQIASAPPLHITIQGKMRSSDLTRKWSVWNIAANDLEILVRPNNQRQLAIAAGPSATGQTFGNLYTLDPTKLTDDDYGAMQPYYTTYMFTDHDQEQALGIGSDMHLVKRVHSFVTGVGLVIITPIVNSLYNFQPGLTPRLLSADSSQGTLLKSDLEWTCVGLRGQRIAFRVSVQPLPGVTDVQLRLQKFVVGMMRDPIAPFRQSGV